MVNAWSDIEVELIIADYFSMLRDELSGLVLNKTQHRKKLKSVLQNRSDSSIEYKHQNISAILIKYGLPFIKGYKPMWNYQQILEEKTIEYLSTQKQLIEPILIYFADSKEIVDTPIADFSTVYAAPPEKHVFSEPQTVYQKRPIKINYLEREQNNSLLGTKGEAFIFEYERWRLTSLGEISLADKIQWVAKEDDGAGFDILSKNLDGSDRFIEVKTTKLTKDTPIFFSKNEYDFSQSNKKNYYLYRVFNFTQNPKLFSINGSFDDFCQKEAIQFRGYF